MFFYTEELILVQLMLYMQKAFSDNFYLVVLPIWFLELSMSSITEDSAEDSELQNFMGNHFWEVILDDDDEENQFQLSKVWSPKRKGN